MTDTPADQAARHGRVHRWRCKTCQVSMSTDNLTSGLAELWDAAHVAAGHEIEEEHPLFETISPPPEPPSPMDEFLARAGEL